MHFSVLDSRYASKLKDLQPILGETNLVYYMSVWALSYAELFQDGLYLPLYDDRENLAKRVALKEVKTKHQIGALIQVLEEDYPDVTFHYGLTSEDLIHNARWTQIHLVLYKINALVRDIEVGIRAFEKSVPFPILAHTHGQPATPVDLGPYLRAKIRKLACVYPEYRLGGSNGQLSILKQVTGNSEFAEFAKLWARKLKHKVPEFEEEINIIYPTAKVGLLQHGPSNEGTMMSAMSLALKYRALARTFWDHCQRKILVIPTGEGQMGSSAMPHKINPILSENAEGCFSNAYHILINGIEANADSRGLRDLSGSVVNRQLSEAFCWIYLGLQSLSQFISSSDYNIENIQKELMANPECMTEYLRYYLQEIEGHTDPYWALKKEPPTNFVQVIKRMKRWKLPFEID